MSHSLETRSKAVSAIDSGNYSQKDICAIFDISLSSLRRWLSRKHNGEDLSPRKSKLAGRQRRIDADGLVTLKKAVEANPSITLAELSLLFEKEHNISVGKSVLSRELLSLNLRYKKISLKSAEQCTDEVKKKEKNI